MIAPVRAIVVMTVVAAAVVFAAVQDRVTAAGIRRYVALQRSAIAGGTPRVTIDEVMRPAVDRSLRQGVLWGSVALLAGLCRSRGHIETKEPPTIAVKITRRSGGSALLFALAAVLPFCQ